MHDGKALQSGTSHNFGDGFARAYDVTFTDKDNSIKYAHQTSWGVSTRMIGALIMVHGDDNGLVLPPRIAPTQVMIVPIMQNKEGVLEKANELKKRLAADFRVKLDDSDKTPGFKFADQEMRGIPVRVEIGPKDIEANKCIVVRRDNREKIEVSLDELEDKITEILAAMQKDMLERARNHRDSHTYSAVTYDEFKEIIAGKPGFIKAHWCENRECEDKIKEDTSATARCIPFEDGNSEGVCVCCGKPAKKLVYWGKAY